MKTFPVAIVVSPFKGLMGVLLSFRARKSRGTLTIDSDQQTVQITGESATTAQINRQFTFGDIREIESRGPLFLTLRLTSGDEITLKDVEDLAEILRLFDGKVTDKTLDLVRKRIDKFEQRLGKA